MTRLQQLIDAIPDKPKLQGVSASYEVGVGASYEVRFLDALVVRLDAIIRAYHEILTTAAEELPSVAYDNDYDEIGSRTCCGVLSYEQHHGTCVVPMMQELTLTFSSVYWPLSTTR